MAPIGHLAEARFTVSSAVHIPAERGEEGVEELKAELFFFVVAGEEDSAVLVEAVDQTSNGVGRVPHQGSAYRALGQCQPTDRALVIGLEHRLEVVLLQEPERGLARLLLVGLLQGLEQAPLQQQEQVLVRVPVQGLEQRLLRCECRVLLRAQVQRRERTLLRCDERGLVRRTGTGPERGHERPLGPAP